MKSGSIATNTRPAAEPLLRYVLLVNGRCGLSAESPAAIKREQGTANVRCIRLATETDVIHVRSMGGYVPEGRIAKVAARG
jgi:hypothetical protein